MYSLSRHTEEVAFEPGGVRVDEVDRWALVVGECIDVTHACHSVPPADHRTLVGSTDTALACLLPQIHSSTYHATFHTVRGFIEIFTRSRHRDLLVPPKYFGEFVEFA
ncbi:hypothetical protein HYDPIDRAFT_117448 [Hydnomerulius pinastri MD-312]|uniref:Unplaced genomic scaffold scaffold_41, whole genome shotgun sequence n=1 Tax=Hydnomerulius pinastri MD-312 TaxID=994086 RepID=A0A0C9V487_9AGAM|nr:hypothetical protein HYDPIDRAFT_117448 [Hydnomerulius pinastri MD-312]